MSAVPETRAPFEPAWRHRYAGLGPAFSTALAALPLPSPQWAAVSDDCARLLGWPTDWWQRPGMLEAMSGGAPLPGMQPLATVYSGHQFGVWAGQLGDGRALLLGEVETPAGPMELQLKGSGRTPYSRMGDGRAVLRSTIREFLCSEAMAALGIPTTRALCMLASPLPVQRETVETAAIVTRVAPSFIRFGHFEHCTHTAQDFGALKRLVDFTIEHYYPECDGPAALLETVTRRTAELVAQWQAVGFCHGVMNTDNMSILGLTIDYGPFGFLDAFDPNHICNHSDDRGRYAYGRQPDVAFWNLHALAQALLPLVDGSEPLLAALDAFRSTFPAAQMRRWRAKLGLASEQPDDAGLIEALLQRMAEGRADFTITLRRLADFSSAEGARNDALRDLFIDREAFDAWGLRYAARLRAEGSVDAERAGRMNRVNPKYVLRNHLAQRAIEAAQTGDYSEIERLLKVLARPFDEQPEHAADAGFPPEGAQSIEVSCSS